MGPGSGSLCCSHARLIPFLPWRCLKHGTVSLYPNIALTERPRVPVRQRSRKPDRAQLRCDAASGKGAATETTSKHQNAKAAVDEGLEAFNDKQVDQALKLFLLALELSPDEDEARAAYYNIGCCYVKQKNWKGAVDAVVRAVNDYNLSFDVALEDPDLAALRERREWIDALPIIKGGLSDNAYINLRTEAKAPFRGARIFIFGGLLAGASLGLFIIVARLVAAVRGGEGAPDLQESLQNFSINAGAVAVLSWLVSRDWQAAQKDKQVVEREESLAKLQVSVGPTRVLPLGSFRGSVRPLVLVGSRGHLSRCLRAAQPLQAQLRERGVSVVCLETNSNDPEEKLKKLKKEMNVEKKVAGFGGAEKAKVAAEDKTEDAGQAVDAKWRLDAYDKAEWLEWMETQKKSVNVKAEDVWVQVQLDGTVRSSGTGMPPWQKFVDDLPELDDIRTRFTDGIGRR